MKSGSIHPQVALQTGKGVSQGVVLGKVFIFESDVNLAAHLVQKKSQGDAVELKRFNTALEKVVQDLEKIIAQTKKEVGAHEAEIFEAHQMMIQDEELISPILYGIQQEHLAAEVAVDRAFQLQIEVFQSSDSEYMRERALDLKDLRTQLFTALDPNEKPNLNRLPAPVILVAEDLTPSQTITMDRKNVLGIITEKGGETSHTAIIARTLGIPSITGLEKATQLFTQLQKSGITEFAMDGAEGTIFKIDTPEVRSYFLMRAEQELQGKKKTEVFRGKPTLTQDAHQIHLYGNIGSVKDAQAVMDGDGEGIGLYRTEFLFMERNQAPTLLEQYKSYLDVLNIFSPKEVIIRTLDIGGDKPISYLPFPKEENPFLGVRAIRYCLQHPEFFKTQIKAMLLANHHGNLSIMLPMVSRASEAKACADLIQECHQELKKESVGFTPYLDRPFKVGAMVEIPSLIFEIRELKEYVSFVSVGTNDLLQYSVAVDRMNPALQSLYSAYNLGFIRMMNLLAENALQAGLELGICGELGRSEDLIPLWIAMGYQKLSMTPSEILNRRSLISKFTVAKCQNLLNEVLRAKNEIEVKAKLADYLLN